jgi:hypothetical protein
VAVKSESKSQLKSRLGLNKLSTLPIMPISTCGSHGPMGSARTCQTTILWREAAREGRRHVTVLLPLVFVIIPGDCAAAAVRFWTRKIIISMEFPERAKTGHVCKMDRRSFSDPVTRIPVPCSPPLPSLRDMKGHGVIVWLDTCRGRDSRAGRVSSRCSTPNFCKVSKPNRTTPCPFPS